MRTNIDIDDGVLDAAMKAGPFTTKKDAVEAGLRLLARQAAYRELLRTVRSAIDVLLASFCIQHGHVLLHADRHFDAFEDHRGLRAWRH